MGEATTFPLIVYSVSGHGPTPKCHFVPGVPKFPQLRLLRLWGPIILRVYLRLRWRLKQSCSPHWELFNDMSHATCTLGNWGDSRLLVVGSQIVNLTLDPSFGHNLCLKCPNGSCKPILDIYVLRDFQWYKELFNPLSFDPWNYPLKILESTRTLTPKVEAPLGVWGFIPSHFPTLPGAWGVTPGLPSWSATSQALALVTSPRLRLWQQHSKMFLVASGNFFMLTLHSYINCWTFVQPVTSIVFPSILMERVIDSIFDIFAKLENKSTKVIKSLHCQIVT